VKPDYISEQFLQRFIHQALREDLGEGDHSTLACVPAEKISRAKLLIKETGILAGVALAQGIFTQYDPRLFITTHIHDGASVSPGEVALVVNGPARSILAAERLVLNCMQRMSGIATATRSMADLVAGTGVVLMDTRKTTPNFRLLEKWAVLIGGGTNHRLGLFDMIMLKDNHIQLAGGVREAINQTKQYLRATGKNLCIEVETRTLEEVNEAVATGGVDIIMLDNMSTEDIKRAVNLVGRRCKTEASGGITAGTIGTIAASGVDYISVGALTHTVKSLDLSLKIF
jgi:nicotinate-nucleotide pyrophosphorylase (carboxylating)